MRDPPPDPRPRHSDPHPRGLRPAAPRPPPLTVGLGHGRLRHLGSGTASRRVTGCSSGGAGAREAGVARRASVGDGEGQGTGGGRGPRSPRQLPATPRMRPCRTAGSAQAHGPSSPAGLDAGEEEEEERGRGARPPARGRACARGGWGGPRGAEKLGPVRAWVVTGAGGAGRVRAETGRAEGRGRPSPGRRGAQELGRARRGRRSAGPGDWDWDCRVPAGRESHYLPWGERQSCQVGRHLSRDFFVVTWRALPDRDFL